MQAVLFVLRHRDWLSIYRASGGVDIFFHTCRNRCLEQPKRTARIHLEIPRRITHTDRLLRGRLVEDSVDAQHRGAHRISIGNIAVDILEIFHPAKRIQVFRLSSRVIIESHDRNFLLEERLCEMAAYESGGASNKCATNFSIMTRVGEHFGIPW